MLLTKISVSIVALAVWSAHATVVNGPTPIARVTKMLEGIMAKIEMQGKEEQESYEKFSFWCKDTLTGAASDITKAKQSIEDLQNKIIELKGGLGSLGASVKQLKSDVASNLEAQKESQAVRQKEHESFEEDRSESEQCIGALESSLRVLSSGKKFLQNGMQSFGASEQAQLMSVAADVRSVLQKPVSSRFMSEQDLKTVRDFVKHPSGGLSAMQVGAGQNPFGDYAPQSDQIVGILKGLHDSFVESLQKSKDQEANEQKAFEELMATKGQELKTLQGSLEQQETTLAEKKRSLAESKEQLDDTKVDLESLKTLFEETKVTCKEKSDEWSQRSELRKKELEGIQKAKEILSSKEAVKAFKGAASLVQLTQTSHRAVRMHSHAGGTIAALRSNTYAQLRHLAARFGNLATARLAVQVKSGDGFDKVIFMIDQMIEDLRKEEQEDIEHRDRCQNSKNQNENEADDLDHSKAAMSDEIDRLENLQEAKQKDLSANKGEAKDIEKDMAERLKLRNQEHEEFKRAMEADANAIEIIGMAEKALKEFYEKQKSAKKLLQLEAAPKEAPKVAWDKSKEGGKYGGQKSLNEGALAALGMIKEDLQKEIDTGKSEDAENQKRYEQDATSMEEALKSKKDTIEAIEKQMSEMGVNLEDKRAALAQNGEDAKEAEAMKAALATDCAWVATHFDKRRKARKAEIDGLVEAKGHLAKAGQGAEDDELDLDSE